MSKSTSGPALCAALPAHLSERARCLNDKRPAVNGAFILYWMHHAVRDHENPALDTALALGQRLALPVLVYQGLGGSHPYGNDRHQRFILEGARETHAALIEQGISAVFHLPTPDDDTSPLVDLIDKAAVAVFEDYPAPPFPRWADRLAGLSEPLVIAVDAACIVPLRLHGRCFTRAFEFRRATASEFAQRIPLAWPESEPSWARYDGPMPFEPVDLAGLDIDASCADAAIDHTVPPIPDTQGGSSHGYARWVRFRDAGLRGYARDRNDAAMAWPRGVSRLSPYLHHGHVSPWRIAREAWQIGGAGVEKFLDELLVWRELAYQFCFHTADPEQLAALPQWAQETLERHRPDERPLLIDPQSLAASETPDPLWNLAQDSLRLHGELHNNLRMTWAKAIPFWRPDPETALRALVELNHRFALDGSDPNSYGGLLWALGLFDRPFDEQPVIGRLRPRSTQAHAQRLDVDAYARRATRPASGASRRIAVVGAGIAGLAAANALRDQGHEVEVFEKSRGPGGRSATRRLGDFGFDHGAQYFKVRDPRFRRAVDAWVEAGHVMPWRGRVARLRDGMLVHDKGRGLGFVGVPGMNAIGKAMAAGLDLRRATRVVRIDWTADSWQLYDDDNQSLGRYDALVIAVPAPQAVPLLEAQAPDLARCADAIAYEPAWAAMVTLESPIHPGAEALFVDDTMLAWAANNSAKPKRDGETWVLHATSNWSRAHLESEPVDVIKSLGDRFAELLGLPVLPIEQSSAQRWLYALVQNPLADEALWQPSRRLAVCGDWCAGPRIESAFLSGQAAAGFLLRHFAAEKRRG